MLRHSPLPPLVLSSALALGLALSGARTDATVGPSQEKPPSEAPEARNTTTMPGEGISRAVDARRAGPRAL